MVIEALDRSCFGPFLEGIDWGATRMAVSADHATPCSARGHTDDPVPLLLVGAGTPADPAPSGEFTFGEEACARGSLGERRGGEVLELLRGLPAGSR